MTTRKKQVNDQVRDHIFSKQRINFTDMSAEDVAAWSLWITDRHEQDYTDLRARSYFRVNLANLKAEIAWRSHEIPF